MRDVQELRFSKVREAYPRQGRFRRDRPQGATNLLIGKTVAQVHREEKGIHRNNGTSSFPPLPNNPKWLNSTSTSCGHWVTGEGVVPDGSDKRIHKLKEREIPSLELRPLWLHNHSRCNTSQEGCDRFGRGQGSTKLNRAKGDELSFRFQRIQG